MLVTGSPERPRTVEQLLGPELLARLDRLDLRTSRVFPGTMPGERRGKRRGRSVEFEDYRRYIRGDDLRHIDWNVYARLDRLFIKIFLEEQDLSLHVAVDVSPSMAAGRPSKSLFAQRLATAIGYVGLLNRDRVALSAFGGGSVEHSGPMRGRASLQRLGRFVMDKGAAGDPREGGEAGPDFKTAMARLAQARAGKGVTVVVSDFLFEEGYRDGLTTLAAAPGHDVYCVQVLSPGEIDPTLERRSDGSPSVVGDLRLTDVESGRATEVTVSAAMLEKYKASVAAYCDELASFCASREMAHLLVRSDADVPTLVSQRLRAVGMLR